MSTASALPARAAPARVDLATFAAYPASINERGGQACSAHQRATAEAMRHVTIRTVVLLLLTAVLGLQTAPVQADRYVFDRGHTAIGFSWDHLGLSRQSGRVLEYEGSLDFDPDKPEEAKVEVRMSAASLWTGVEELDRQLRSSDYFDVQSYPDITFRSTLIKKTSDKTGEVMGELTMLGRTHPVILNVIWNFTGEHPFGVLHPSYKDKVASGFSATARLKRSQWGLNRGVPLISDEIRIVIETELIKK